MSEEVETRGSGSGICAMGATTPDQAAAKEAADKAEEERFEELERQQQAPTLGREDFMELRQNAKVVKFYSEELESNVDIRILTGDEWSSFLQEQANRFKKGRALENFLARAAVKFLGNPDGSRMFHDANMKELGQISALALEPIVTFGMEINGLGNPDAAVEQEVENSNGDRG